MRNLQAIEAFVEAANQGSFTEAARRLRTSKSAVSRHVAALEAELGARLFQRTTRSLALTEAGRAWHERVVRVLADLEEANLAVNQFQSAPRGMLRVSAPMSFGFLRLAPALPAFLERHPRVEIDLSLNDRFVDVVEEGFDVAVRIGALADSSLVARRLAPMRRVVCASPAYLRARGIPATPADLARHDCIFNSNMASAREWGFDPARGAPPPGKLRGRLCVNNGDAMREAARGGLGLVYLPTFIVGDDLRAGTLVSVLEEFIVQDMSLNAVYPTTRGLSPKVRAFVDFLGQTFGPEPAWDRTEG